MHPKIGKRADHEASRSAIVPACARDDRWLRVVRGGAIGARGPRQRPPAARASWASAARQSGERVEQGKGDGGGQRQEGGDARP